MQHPIEAGERLRLLVIAPRQRSQIVAGLHDLGCEDALDIRQPGDRQLLAGLDGDRSGQSIGRHQRVHTRAERLRDAAEGVTRLDDVNGA